MYMDHGFDVEQEVSSENRPRIPVRFTVLVLVFLGTTFSVIMRANISVAIVSMVNETHVNISVSSDNVSTCGKVFRDVQNQTIQWNLQVEHQEGLFNWSVRTQAVILSSFYYGWTLATFPGSIVVQHFGAMRPYGLSVLFSAICTILCPVAAYWNVYSLILLRVAIGIAQGVISPARNVLISNWTPLGERGRVCTFVLSGMDIGVTIGMLGSGALASTNFLGGWPSSFYVFGFITILWFLLWVTLVYEKPSQDPRISAAELKAIQADRNETITLARCIPWKAIFTSIPMWAMAIAVFGQFWGRTMLMAELPTYLANILQLNIQTNGILSGLPYTIRFASAFVSGPIADLLLKSGRFTTTTVRKISTTLGIAGFGACILMIALIGLHPFCIIALLCLAMFFSSFTSSGCILATMDMSQEHTAILSSICYTFGGVAAILTPLVAGEFIRNGHTLKNWNYVFMTTAAVMFVATVIFDCLGTAEPQEWSSGYSSSTSSEDEDETASEEVDVS